MSAQHTLRIGDSYMELHVAMPSSSEARPAVMLFQEGFGVNQHLRHVAQRLAEAGYVAVAPTLYHRTGGWATDDYSQFEPARPHVSALTVEGLVADVQATYEWLGHQREVRHDRIGALGFCMGGRVALLANTELPLAAAVSFYGGNLPSLVDRVPQVHGPQLFVWGGQDKVIPADHRRTAIDAFEAAGKPYTSCLFSQAGHAFHNDQGSAYNPHAAREAWALAMAFLGNNLQ